MAEHVTVEASSIWVLAFVVVWRFTDPTPPSVPPGLAYEVF